VPRTCVREPRDHRREVHDRAPTPDPTRPRGAVLASV